MQRTIRRGALAVSLSFALACGSQGDGSSSGSPQSPSGGPAAPADDQGQPAPSAASPSLPPVTPRCATKQAQKRDDTWTVDFGGDKRTADVHVPPSYDPTRAYPLVLNFHGLTSDAPQESLLSNMNAKADSAGFIVVYPQGTGSPASWNAGACCGDAVKTQKNDVGFVSALLDVLEDRLCVDDKRVFSTGMSNGAFLSHRLACELGARIAAVAPVAGVLGVQSCTPPRPVPVMHFHGTLDALVPYAGSTALGFIPVPDSFSGWAKRDGCTGQPVTTYDKLDTQCSTYEHCDAGSEVTLCTVKGGGHTWPGGLPVPALGYTTRNLDATDAMWDFFVKHPMP